LHVRLKADGLIVGEVEEDFEVELWGKKSGIGVAFLVL